MDRLVEGRTETAARSIKRPRRLRLRVYVSIFEKKKLQDVARRNGKTLSDFVREAMNEIIADCDDSGPVMKTRRKVSPQ